MSRTPAASFARLKVEYQQHTFERVAGVMIAWPRGADPASDLVFGLAAATAGQLEVLLLAEDPHRGPRQGKMRGLH